MKFRISDYAYTITGGVIVGVLLFGTVFLDWGREDYAFALLLFLIVSLGIRLDDISKILGTDRTEASDSRNTDGSLLAVIREMDIELKRIRKRLDGIADTTNRDRPDPP